MTADEFTLANFNRSYSVALAAHQCVVCGKSADGFRDLLSAKEFLISATCQVCQDQFFVDTDDQTPVL